MSSWKPLKKRGVMGIGTLIIFIAMILTAAIAAGVLLRTAGLLQQKSLQVGTEARERLVTKVDFINVVADTNATEEDAYEFDILVRTSPGSADIQMKTLGLTYWTDDVSFSASLMHPNMPEYWEDDITGLTTSAISVHDLESEYHPLDRRDDTAKIIANLDGANEGIQFNLTQEETLINVSLGEDISGAAASPVNFNRVTIPIRTFERTNNSLQTKVWGFIYIDGNVATNDQLTGGGLVAQVQAFTDVCSFDTVIPETRWCFDVQVGDTDTILESGELFYAKYKLNKGDELPTDSKFNFQFTPKAGGVSEVFGTTPDVINFNKLQLWPR